MTFIVTTKNAYAIRKPGLLISTGTGWRVGLIISKARAHPRCKHCSVLADLWSEKAAWVKKQHKKFSLGNSTAAGFEMVIIPLLW